MHVDLYLNPLPVDKTILGQKTVVVIDVLRATTTICAALHAKARGVVPTSGPGEAGELWTRLGQDVALLAGERNGVRIDNFTLGNSPLEFTESTVSGKIIILTTTNGTPAFVQLANARELFAASLVNISALAARVAEAENDLVIVCSGREGSFSIEDTLCGGMLIHQLATVHKVPLSTNDAGSLALLLFRSNKSAIRESIRQGEHGRFLISLGFESDIDVASDVDSLPVVPVYRDGRLVLE